MRARSRKSEADFLCSRICTATLIMLTAQANRDLMNPQASFTLTRATSKNLTSTSNFTVHVNLDTGLNGWPSRNGTDHSWTSTQKLTLTSKAFDYHQHSYHRYENRFPPRFDHRRGGGVCFFWGGDWAVRDPGPPSCMCLSIPP